MRPYGNPERKVMTTPAENLQATAYDGDETEDAAQKVTLKGIAQLWLRTARIIEERTTTTDNRPKLFRELRAKLD